MIGEKVLASSRYLNNTTGGSTTFTLNRTWVEWCEDKMIIGPPRYRSGREMAELDDEYLTGEEFLTHCLPWIKTWAELDDPSWRNGPHRTTLPDWVIAEYIAAPNPTVC
jgi:hypothetical protein